MEDVLLRVGTIVKAQFGDDIETVLITGKRQVKIYRHNDGKIYDYRAWDYVGVSFPDGGNEDDICHFDHPDITEIVHALPDELYK
jgi:hypothetical protein